GADHNRGSVRYVEDPRQVRRVLRGRAAGTVRSGGRSVQERQPSASVVMLEVFPVCRKTMNSATAQIDGLLLPWHGEGIIQDRFFAARGEIPLQSGRARIGNHDRFLLAVTMRSPQPIAL